MFSLSSFVWLVLGAFLQLFYFGRWMMASAAWLIPLFMLRFVHLQDSLTSLLWVWLAIFFATSAANWRVMPVPSVAYIGIMMLIAAVYTLPFLAHYLIASRIPGFASALIFPLAWVTVEFISGYANPYSTWGNLAYTQHGNLPLMQLASITGLWGISFLVTWSGSVLNWAWDQNFEWVLVKNGLLFFSAVLSLVMLAGGARLAFSPESPTVRVAGIGWPPGIFAQQEFMRALAPDLPEAKRRHLQEAFTQLQDIFFDRSQRQAQAGARIIAWPEGNLMVFAEDEAAFFDRAGQFSREHNVFLLAGMGTLHPVQPRPVENKAVLFDPEGEILSSYIKITAVPGFEASANIRGVGSIPAADTPYGRIASPICYDMDFPAVIRRTGKQRVDLMLVPASDYKAITRLHQHMAEFRAIENGAAMFRITRWGGSGAVDPFGRRLAVMNDFSAQDNVMVAQVPISAGVRTIYTRFGDWFAWLCVSGLLSSIAWAALV